MQLKRHSTPRLTRELMDKVLAFAYVDVPEQYKSNVLAWRNEITPQSFGLFRKDWIESSLEPMLDRVEREAEAIDLLTDQDDKFVHYLARQCARWVTSG